MHIKGVIKKLISTPFIYLISAIWTVIFYIIILHPVSGWVGGIFLILLGLFIPSIINILCAIFVAELFKVSRKSKIVIFILTSFILGINTNFFYFIKYLPLEKNQITSQIKTKTSYASLPISILDVTTNSPNTDIFIPNNYFLSPIKVGGNEGIMKMYFEKRRSFVENVLESHGYILLSDCKKSSYCDKKNSIIYTITNSDTKFANLEVKIFRDGKVNAWLRKEKIPYINIYDRTTYGKLLNGHFVQNVTDILLHDNFWSYLTYGFGLNAIVDKKEIDDFIRKGTIIISRVR